MKKLFVALSLLFLTGPLFARLWGDRTEQISQAMTPQWVTWAFIVGVICVVLLVAVYIVVAVKRGFTCLRS
jgi:hypothetical protein